MAVVGPPPDRTVAWFEKLRRRCVDHYRALSSIQAAHKYALRLYDSWDALDVDLASALHAAGVIAYARPFTSAKTNVGKVQYPVRDLKREPGFDLVLHDHLLTLRDRLIAHSDYGLLRSTMYLQAVGDSEELPVTLGLNVKRLVGIESRDLAGRYVGHFSSCVTRIARTFDAEFNSLARHVRDNPKHFSETQNLPLEMQQHGPIPTLQPMPKPTGAAGDVKEPQFPDQLSGYKYEMLNHQRALIRSGTYRVQVEGKLVDYDFEITGPEIDAK
jgi:hypothetical protein